MGIEVIFMIVIIFFIIGGIVYLWLEFDVLKAVIQEVVSNIKELQRDIKKGIKLEKSEDKDKNFKIIDNYRTLLILYKEIHEKHFKEEISISEIIGLIEYSQIQEVENNE